jgi:hypothetical protein
MNRLKWLDTGVYFPDFVTLGRALLPSFWDGHFRALELFIFQGSGGLLRALITIYPLFVRS